MENQKNEICWTEFLSSKSPNESDNTSIEESIDKIKEAFQELSKAVGGFSNDQRDIILKICFENTWENHGYDRSEIENIFDFERSF